MGDQESITGSSIHNDIFLSMVSEIYIYIFTYIPIWLHITIYNITTVTSIYSYTCNIDKLFHWEHPGIRSAFALRKRTFHSPSPTLCSGQRKFYGDDSMMTMRLRCQGLERKLKEAGNRATWLRNRIFQTKWIKWIAEFGHFSRITIL